jgi:hypothetical protein
MAELRRYSNAIGWLGVLCLTIYWAARFVPGIADLLPVSSFGKFAVFGIFLAGGPWTIIAAIRCSKWWWVAVVVSAITLWDLYVLSSKFPIS